MISNAIKECIDTMDLNVVKDIKTDSINVEDLKILIPGPPGSDYHDEYFYIMYALYKENQKPDSKSCDNEFKTFFKTLVAKFGEINFSETKTNGDESHAYNCLCFAINGAYNVNIIEFIAKTYPETLAWTKHEDALYCAVKNNRTFEVVRIIVSELILLAEQGQPIQHNYNNNIFKYDVCKQAIVNDRERYKNGPQVLQYLYNLGFNTRGVLNEFILLFTKISSDEINFNNYFENNILPFSRVLETMDLDTTEIEYHYKQIPFELFLRVLSRYTNRSDESWEIKDEDFLFILKLTVSRQNFITQERRSDFFYRMFCTEYITFFLPSRLLVCLKHLHSLGIEGMFELEIIRENDIDEYMNSNDYRSISVFELFEKYISDYDSYVELLEEPDEGPDFEITEEDAMLIKILEFLIYSGAKPPADFKHDMGTPTIKNWVENDVIKEKIKFCLAKFAMISVHHVPRIAQNSPLRLLPKDSIRKLFEEFLE